MSLMTKLSVTLFAIGILQILSSDAQAGLSSAAAGDPNIPDLIYDRVTGEVIIDLDSSSLIGYSLKNMTDDFFPGGFLPLLVDGISTGLTSELGEASLMPASGGGSLGMVFPTGLDLAGLTSLLSTNTASRYLGAPLVPFDLFVSCRAGDADCDGDVDLDDIIAAVGSFTGPCTSGVDCFGDLGEGAPFDKIRSQGDVNDGMPVTGVEPLQADGDVDLDDIITMVGAFTGPLDGESGAVVASDGNPILPDLIYNPATGEVLLDGGDLPGGGISAYNIKSAGGGILNGNFTSILSPTPATSLPTEIGEFQLSVTPTPSPVSIGNVFPAGMDMTALSAFVTGGTAAGTFGGGSFAWELIVIAASVPEPQSISLAALALLGLAFMRRNRTKR